ncbi:hypothetical protein BB560_005499 [Smittium megazygosporum]|uniref:Transmembrane protein 135 N-terminal domain-containing protein n=1 Tax=Smittium megazygosporum TaxID=133381 RepID=A0A2T9Z4H9_9FUNG|nr:hypothetical protein BB560_005499 [Smittium megazygosporum]
MIYYYFCLKRSYYGFLVKYSGVDKLHPGHPHDVIPTLSRTIKDHLNPSVDIDGQIPHGMTTSEKFMTIPYTESFVSGMDPSLKHEWVQCAMLHPFEESCYIAPFKWLSSVTIKSLSVYLSLHAITTVIFRNKELVKDPLGTVFRIGKSGIRSSLFFGSLVSFAVSVPCMMRKILGRESAIAYWINGAVSGIPVLLEPASRRFEMAMFIFMRGLELIWRQVLRSKNVKSLPFVEDSIFSVSFAILMMFYQNEPSKLNNMLRVVLTRVYGKN